MTLHTIFRAKFHVPQSPTLGAHIHAHGFRVGMGSILLFMGEHGLKQSILEFGKGH